MHRTQISLDEHEMSVLDAAAERTGASRSELIRRTIRAQYGDCRVASRVDALRFTAGTWKDRDVTGSQFVDSIRGGVNDRRARLRPS